MGDRKFVRRNRGESEKREKGQAMVEFALVMPLFLALLCGILDFGYIFACKNSLTHLAGGAAREAAISTATGGSDAASAAQSFVNANRSMSYGAPTVSCVPSGSGSSAYITVTLQEDVPYLTGFTGAITGKSSVHLTAIAAWPVEPYSS